MNDKFGARHTGRRTPLALRANLLHFSLERIEIAPQQNAQIRQYRSAPDHGKHHTCGIAVFLNAGTGLEHNFLHRVQARGRR